MVVGTSKGVFVFFILIVFPFEVDGDEVAKEMVEVDLKGPFWSTLVHRRTSKDQCGPFCWFYAFHSPFSTRGKLIFWIRRPWNWSKAFCIFIDTDINDINQDTKMTTIWLMKLFPIMTFRYIGICSARFVCHGFAPIVVCDQKALLMDFEEKVCFRWGSISLN